MIEKNFLINKVPAILLGEQSEKVFLFIHGKLGCKEEAIEFAKVVCPKGFQVLGIDLPEHGERKEENIELLPWNVVPEFKQVMNYVHENWHSVSIRANSIGAWFSMLSFSNEKMEQALFVSPILDMEQLIKNMMMWANVSEKQLEEQEEIPTEFGETLSWKYYMYAKEHPIASWNIPTSILYAGKDNLTSRDIVDKFVNQFKCHLTVMEQGEHWFHTEEQLDFLNVWTDDRIEKCLFIAQLSKNKTLYEGYNSFLQLKKEQLGENSNDFLSFEKKPKNYQGLYAIIENMLADGWYEEALPYIKEIGEVKPGSQMLMYSGDVALSKGNVEEAKRLWNQAVSEYPNEWQAYCRRADRLKKLGCVQEAIADYEKCLELQKAPHVLDALYSLAQMHEQLGKYEVAIRDHERILEYLAADYHTIDGEMVESLNRKITSLKNLIK